MANTIRKVIEFPGYLRRISDQVDPLEQELSIIRNINWELSKLPDDASVIRCIQFVMQHRGLELNGGETCP